MGVETELGSANPSNADCCRPRKRSRKSKRRSQCRRFRSGRKTRNAFLNFLRAYRKKCCGTSVKEIARNGAKLWNCMTKAQKQPYFRMASKVAKRCRSKHRPRKSMPCEARKRKQRRRCSTKRRRRKSRCKKKRRKKSSCPC